MRQLLKRGNLKLSSKQGIWTLPRITCIGAGICARFCYAKKMENMPSVRASREWKLEQTRLPDFKNKIIAEIRKRKFKVIRIHESGDFYCQTYLDTWKEIARSIPEITFYAFTKAFQLDLWTDLPSNFIIIQSYGSRFDERIDYSKNTGRVIDKLTDLRITEYLCPYHDKEHFTKCGECCNYCMRADGTVKHVAFIKH